MAIEVSSEVRSALEKNARKACDDMKLKHDSFNQDANAIAVYRTLRDMGLLSDGLDDDDRKADKAKALQVLKKGGNASALRQAINATAKKDAESIADEMLASI